jgi:hypothetical protein
MICVPDPATAEWIRDEYTLQISDALRELKASISQIRYLYPSLIHPTARPHEILVHLAPCSVTRP